MFLPRLRTSAYPLIWMLLLGEDALHPVFCPSELRKEHSKVFWCWMWLQWVGFLSFNKESAFFCLSTWAVILKFKKNQGSFLVSFTLDQFPLPCVNSFSARRTQPAISFPSADSVLPSLGESFLATPHTFFCCICSLRQGCQSHLSGLPLSSTVIIFPLTLQSLRCFLFIYYDWLKPRLYIFRNGHEVPFCFWFISWLWYNVVLIFDLFFNSSLFVQFVSLSHSPLWTAVLFKSLKFLYKITLYFAWYDYFLILNILISLWFPVSLFSSFWYNLYPTVPLIMGIST